MSGLNSPYIVRYFQTWVEIEKDPAEIAEFSGSEEDYDEEYDDETEDLGQDSFFYNEIKSSAKKAKKKAERTSSVERSRENTPFMNI